MKTQNYMNATTKKKKKHINANDVNLHEYIKGNANEWIVLTVFFISYKSSVKNFLKWIVNQCRKDTR